MKEVSSKGSLELVRQRIRAFIRNGIGVLVFLSKLRRGCGPRSNLIVATLVELVKIGTYFPLPFSRKKNEKTVKSTKEAFLFESVLYPPKKIGKQRNGNGLHYFKVTICTNANTPMTSYYKRKFRFNVVGRFKC